MTPGGTQDWKDMMKVEIIGNLGDLELPKRNLFLFAGQSMAGKTVSCLHIAKSCIERGKKVLYFDTEEKTIISRAEPNLFKKFFSENKSGFEKLFFYRTNIDHWVGDIAEVKPDLIIIDSLYQPFLNQHPEPRKRARIIKGFLTELRSVMSEQNIGGIITVPIGKIVEDGIARQVPLGGEGVKYLADVKIMIHFTEKENRDDEVGSDRFFVVDRDRRYQFNIKNGGELEQVQ